MSEGLAATAARRQAQKGRGREGGSAGCREAAHPQRVLEAHRARPHERRVLAEAQPRRDAAVRQPGAGGGAAVGTSGARARLERGGRREIGDEQRRLREGRVVELVLGAVGDQVRQIVPQDLVGSPEHRLDGRQLEGRAAEHAERLAALPWEEEGRGRAGARSGSSRQGGPGGSRCGRRSSGSGQRRRGKGLLKALGRHPRERLGARLAARGALLGAARAVGGALALLCALLF